MIMSNNNKSNILIGEAGQVILVKCNNITFKNQEISNVVEGIIIYNSSFCLIENNYINNTLTNGIIIDSTSSENLISGNIINNTKTAKQY